MRRACWRSSSRLPELTRRGQRPAGAGVARQRWCTTGTRRSRLGITPNMIDQTLYDAYGQREVSTMFTQLNQYHVVLELMPGFQKGPQDLRDLYIRTGAGSQCRQQRAGVRRNVRPARFPPVRKTARAARPLPS